MSIASTRKVSGSPNAPSKADYYRRGGNGESFVENIDTTNNVLVNNNDSDNRGNRQDSPFQKQEEKKTARRCLPPIPISPMRWKLWLPAAFMTMFPTKPQTPAAAKSAFMTTTNPSSAIPEANSCPTVISNTFTKETRLLKKWTN